ncbi:hypothetical protein TBR22_A51320 [Luteitalea sp. TBR-22]|uniref:CARDB domain-containing protein n=1 Tax=Luteitalea sp. TBR-22 TaxID=2802971 RepID=UPI001AF16876|nr:CARDB domain-containing protein [Luteitalea sp. TBR-22]BCS35897.1 hypothetical protein TBR22_A51320 [Luteitalea sp. TBR-22]
MRTLTRFVASALLSLAASVAGAQTVIGDLNNFDTINDTGGVCHGFEIEIHDIRSTDITYTFDWNHYGAPRIREDNSDPAHPKVFVRYESTKNPDGSWGANGSFTNPAIPTLTPPSGHTCTDTSVNEGCEHFGLGYYGTPTTVKYRWLVDDHAGGLAYAGAPVGVATPSWSYAPPVDNKPAAVVAVIPAPPVPAANNKAWGEPVWVKVIKTKTHRANPVALADLVSADKDGDGKAEWQNQEPDEVESEWKLLQTSPGGGKNDALEGLPDDMGDGAEQVTRRYEFYKYAAGLDTLDGETGEAMCSDANPASDPADPNYRHGIGTAVQVTDANGDPYFVNCEERVVVGEYIGAQMAGFAAEAPLGLVDHLQDGDTTEPYLPRTVVVGGTAPYTITLSGDPLPQGLSLGTYVDPQTGLERPGVLSGSPTQGGTFDITVDVTDALGAAVSRTYSLYVAGAAPTTARLTVQKAGAGSGRVTGSGIDCGATCQADVAEASAVTLVALPDPGSVFTGWSGACTGTVDCALTMNGAQDVTATFAVSGVDLRVSAASAPPALVSPGSTYLVTDTTTNAGASAAAASTTRFYLSADTTLGKGDVRLGGQRAVAYLTSGEASTGPTTVTVPSAMAVGTYWQLACADDARVVGESNEGNNCTASPTPVEVRLADLRVTVVGEPPSAIAPGMKFTASDTTQNVATVTSGASVTRYYLSTDGVKDAADLLLAGSRSVAALAPDQASTGSRSVTVPATTPVGTYRLIACADAQGKVPEANEANNCAVSAGTVLVDRPDLVVSQVGPVATTIRLGQKMTLADTVTNQGQGPAAASTTRYYLSLDATWSAYDVLLSGTRSVVALAPGASSAGSKVVTVPLAAVPGTYFVLACADDVKKVSEQDESNNCTASGGTVVVNP